MLIYLFISFYLVFCTKCFLVCFLIQKAWQIRFDRKVCMQLLRHGSGEKYLPSVSYFGGIISKYDERGKYLPILLEATSYNYFIVKCLLISNMARVFFHIYLLTYKIELAEYNVILTQCKHQKQKPQLITLGSYVFTQSAAVYFKTLMQIFCTLLTCFVLDIFVIVMFSKVLYSFEFLILPNFRLLLKSQTY